MQRILLLLLSSFLLFFPILSVQLAPKPLFFVYGTYKCPNCKRVLEELIEIYGNESVIFLDIEKRENLERALQVIDIVYNMGKTPETPLVGVFLGEKLLALTIGYTPASFWSEALNNAERKEVIVAWEGRAIGKVTNIETISKLENLLKGEEEPETPSALEVEKKGLSQMLPGIMLTAIADSVNPCVISIFLVLTVLSIQSAGKKKGTLIGLSFITTVFVSYFLLGLGLRTALSRVISEHSWVMIGIGAGAIAFGGYQVLSAITAPFKSTLPGTLKRITAQRVEEIGLKASIVGTFGLGALLSLTLLPCSWGPYLVMVGLIADLSLEKQVLALLLYNLIFIFPLIAVLISVNLLGVRLRRLKYFRATKFPLMKLIAGILLIFVGIYAILQQMA